MFRDTLVKFIHEADIGLRQLRVAGLLVEHFRRHVPVAFGEQDPPQRHALPGGAEPGRPQLRFSVVPRTADEIAAAGGSARWSGGRCGSGNGYTLGHAAPDCLRCGQNEISYKLNIIAEGVNGSHDTSPCFWQLHHSRKAWSMGVCLRGKSGSLAMLAAIRCAWLRVSKKRAVSLESFNSSLTSKRSKSGQLVDQHLSLLQIKCVEAFGEPAIDRGEDVAVFILLGKADCTRRVDDGCP